MNALAQGEEQSRAAVHDDMQEQPNHAVSSGTGSMSAASAECTQHKPKDSPMLRCWRLDELLITGCQDRHCENFWLAKNFLFIHPYPAERSPKMAFSSLDKKY